MAKFKVMVPTLTGSGVGTNETKQGDIVEAENTPHVERLVSLGWLEPVKTEVPKPKTTTKK